MRALLAILILTPAVLQAEEWGHLSLWFTYDGEPPVGKPLVVDRDEEVCGKKPIPSERLIVDKDTGGIANVVVWLANKLDEKVPVHSSYDESAKTPPTLRVRDCRYEPHVLLMRTSQEIFWAKTTDPVGHAPTPIFWNPNNRPSSALVPGGGKASIVVSSEEAQPISVGCTIHPWMQAWILIRDNPYMAVSDAEGHIHIKNLPVGEWDFRIWHEQASSIKNARRSDPKLLRPNSRVRLKIKPGENNFGEQVLSPQLFAKP